MSLRYQKRVNLGNGFGLNFSKTGLSTSYRTKYGSFGSRGYSIRTGIPGLSFRGYFGKSRKPEEQLIGLFVIVLLIGVVIAAMLVWNLLRLIAWGTGESFRAIKRKRRDKAIINLAMSNRDPKITYNQMPVDILRASKGKFRIKELFITPEEEVLSGQPIALVGSKAEASEILSPSGGKVTFVKGIGEKVKEGDFLFIINSN